MKILVISDFRPTITARPEAEIFIGLQKLGHQVSIMTYGDAPYVKRFQENGLRVIPFHPDKKREPKAIAFIRKELEEGKYDILQMFNSLAYFNGIPAAKNLPVKVVLYRGYTGNIAWYDPFIYFKYFHPRVDATVCNVEAIRLLFLKNSLGKPKKYKTIHKGHDIAWYKGEEKADLSPYGVKDSEVKMICVANDRRMKGVKYLLKSTHFLPADCPVHIFLVGKGMDKPEFLKIIADSPIKERIHILGFRKDVPELERACDVFLLASLFGEAITKAVIESMAIGLAPLITDIPGNKGLVIDGESGIVVEPANPRAIADAIRQYVENRDLIKKYGKAAQHRIQTEFHTSKTVKEYEEFYQELLAD